MMFNDFKMKQRPNRKSYRAVFLGLMFVGLTLTSTFSQHDQISAETTEASDDVVEQVETVVNAAGIPLNANLSDFDTIEDFPFEALNDTYELDGFNRMLTNDPVPFPTKLNDGRIYNIAFGGVYNQRVIDDMRPGITSTTEGLRGSDHLYVPLPPVGMETSEIVNITPFTKDGNGLDNGGAAREGVPLLGPQIAIQPHKATTATQRWATYAYRSGMGMGSDHSGFSLALNNATGANNGETPVILQMYRRGSSVLAYGVSFNSQTRDIDGYYKVKIEPIGTKGRVRNTIKYLNATSETPLAALAYGIHVDIQTKHTESKLYSLGNDSGLYFRQPKISDNKPYLLKFHMTGYDHSPVAQFANDQYNDYPWDKVGGKFTEETTPAEPGKDVQYKLGHPVVAYRWEEQPLAPLEIREWVLEQSVTSADAKDPTLNKTASNLTTSNIANTNVGDTLKYTVEMELPSSITKGVLEDDLPTNVSSPQNLVLNYEPGGTSVPLDPDDVYDAENHQIVLPKQDFETGTVTLTYEVDVLPAAADTVLKSQARIEGIDADGDKLKGIYDDCEVTVKPIPYGLLTVSYLNEAGTDIAPKKIIDDQLIGSAYAEEHIEIDGYSYLKAVGKESGTITKEPQTLDFIYEEHPFNLRQEVNTLTGNPALVVNNNEEIIYKATLESLMDESTIDEFYGDFTITEAIDDSLENVTDLTFETDQGVPVGSITYDATKRQVIATLRASDQLHRSTNLIVSYHACVKDKTPAGTKVSAKAKAKGSYSDGMIIDEHRSNEVVSNVFVGALKISSLPKDITFSSGFKVSSATQRIEMPEKMSDDLVVEDTRWNKAKWTMTARLDTELTSVDDPTKTVENAIRYVYNGKEIILTNKAEVIYTSETVTDHYTINSNWSEAGDGLKLETAPGSVKKAGDYTAVIEWELKNAP